MIMNPIAKFVVAALLLTGTTAGALVPAVNNAPATTPPAAVTTAPQSATELTAAEATAIALEHAGLTEAEVTGLKTRWEMDDGIPEWEVEFSCGDYEFDYTIHALTGKILEWDKDYEPTKKAPSDPPATQPPVIEPPATEPPATEPSATELTGDEALSIALADAGLSSADVTNVRTHRDMDDGVPEWEVEFSCGDYEFDYTIHAVTGKILDRDKDYEPKKEKPTDPPAAEPAKTKLTKEEALAIALAHAGLTADQVRRIQCEYDVDDGIPEWEVEFRFGNYEFEYTIHAETGKILEWEKELDD